MRLGIGIKPKPRNTPDTVPSLETVTPESVDSSNTISRVLFEDRNFRHGTPPPSKTVAKWRTLAGHDDSFAESRSDATVAPACQEDGAAESEDDSGFDSFEQILSLRRKSQVSLLDSSTATESPVRAACHTGFTPDISDIIKVFDRTKPSPEKKTEKEARTEKRDVLEDAPTEIASNTVNAMSSRVPQLDSLHRQNDALKDIIRKDSQKMLEVKKNLETAKSEEMKHLSEIRLLREEVKLLKRERDLQREHENNDRDTIKLLKAELDTATKPASEQAVSLPQMEQLKAENELFAAQIIENEQDIKQIRAELQRLEKENEELRLATKVVEESIHESAVQVQKLDQILEQDEVASETVEEISALEDSSFGESVDIDRDDKVLYPRLEIAETTSSEENKPEEKEGWLGRNNESALEQQVRALAARLLAVEEEREQSRILQEEKKKELEQELAKIKSLLTKTPDPGSENHFEGIEVQISEAVVESKRVQGPKHHPSRPNSSSWEPLCDCFAPRTHTVQ